jgi:hypothetical protein
MSSSTQDLIPQLHLGDTFGALFLGVVFAAMLVTIYLQSLGLHHPNIFHGTVSLV